MPIQLTRGPAEAGGGGATPAPADPAPSLAGRTERRAAASPVLAGTSSPAGDSPRPLGSQRLEDILLELGVRQKYVHYMIRRQRQTREPMVDIMRDCGLVPVEMMARAVALHAGYPYFSADDAAEMARGPALEGTMSRFEGYVPVGRDEADKMRVAVSEVTRANEARNSFHDQAPRIVIASENTIQKIYRRHYAHSAEQFDEALKALINAVDNRTIEDNPGLSQTLLGALLRHACYAGASDIYLHKSEYTGIVKLKVNGEGSVFRHLDAAIYDLLLNKLVMENSNAEDLRREPQEAVVRLHTEEARRSFEDVVTRYGFRMELTESRGGARGAVIRILDRQSNEVEFERLGFDASTDETLRRYVNASTGLVLVTGPTGSGKSTTLYSLLKLVDPIERSVQTIENPIEYRSGLWIQNEVPRDVDEAKGTELLLNALLRMAPDVILFGEVRNNLGVANTLLDASNTGHLVFTTLHTNSAALAVTRLRNLGVKMDGLAQVLHGILAQRLVKVLCDHCKVPDDRLATMEALQQPWLGAVPRTPYRGVGCPHCDYTGFGGRRMIYELLDGSIVRGLIEKGAPASEIASEGIKPGHSMRACGLRLVAQGATTLEQVSSVVNDGW